MRCFVAVDLPPAVKGEVERAVAGFEKAPGLRLVPSGNLHVTLAFLGEKTPEQVENASGKLSAIAAHAFDARLSGAGFFPSESFARVMWLGVQGRGLEELHRQVIGALGMRERFSAHLTVARLSARPGEQVMALRNKLESASFQPFRVTGFSLKKSELLPAGAEYSDVESYRLV